MSVNPLFDAAFAEVIGNEGGYVNDPNDPGGETKYGISKRSYPHLDIPNITLEQAEQIYLTDYWQKAGCDLCPAALAIIQFDCAVNNGVGQAVRLLQQGLGVAADGIIGPQTKAALEHSAGSADTLTNVITNVHGGRISLMAGLPTWPTYGKGWSRRLARLPYRAAQIATEMGSG